MVSTNPWRAQVDEAFRSSPAISKGDKEEWEDWEDDDTEEILINFSPDPSEASKMTTRGTQSRSSAHKIQRLKSRQRQKAQNAKAGIKVVTDMSKFRRQPHIVQQLKSAGGNNADANGKFADAVALKALEGEPSSASIGSFSWLKRKPTNIRERFNKKHNRTPTAQDLSPASRPIVIGIAVPGNSLSEHQVSPQTSTLETPIDLQRVFQQAASAKNTKDMAPLTPSQQRSVWSPDTEASTSPHYSLRAASSIYSQPSMYGGAPIGLGYIPPVPALPPHLTGQQSTVRPEIEEEDTDTPCTEFEEDGSPVQQRKSSKAKAIAMSPQSAQSAQSAGGRSQGWWDTVTTPFMTQSSPLSAQLQQNGTSPGTRTQDWWVEADEKKKPSVASASLPGQLAAPTPRQVSPEVTDASSSRDVPERQETHSEKAQILFEENETPSDQPPPYSPPQRSNAVKYCAILPLGQSPALSSLTQPIPSPGPVSPGLPGTMTSQGAISMSEIPLTPAPRVVNLNSTYPALPQRPAGTYLPGEHFNEAPGPTNRVERQRRRHEKEEVIARKAGGFWRGRGCMPENGCFGRSGREGRKRRRICLGLCGGFIAILILIIVLAVTLTRKAATSAPVESIWLNLTDFPPMPTGVLTVTGPENPTAATGCITPSTLWSCSLPKEQQADNLPYQPNQPKFIFQTQYDNSTRALWKVTDTGEQSPTVSTRAAAVAMLSRRDLVGRNAIASASAYASNFIRSLVTDPGFLPSPAPPSTKEMYFLGNTTDGIVSENKAGEPTPFYISLLQSVNQTVGANMVTRRGINNGIDSAPENGSTNWNISNLLPDPVLNPDGTGAPAQLYPRAFQQPVRLFDRGLPTEHYGFYSYYDKSIYVKAVDTPTNEAAIPDDEDGGAREDSAKFIVTWVSSRFKVQIWTRMENTTRLLGNGTSLLSSPGTMPYPVTITLDTHGGNKNNKTTFYYGVDDRQHIDRGNAKLLLNFMDVGGTLINPMGSSPDDSLGGYDGGTGGCKCEWVNFKGFNTVMGKTQG